MLAELNRMQSFLASLQAGVLSAGAARSGADTADIPVESEGRGRKYIAASTRRGGANWRCLQAATRQRRRPPTASSRHARISIRTPFRARWKGHDIPRDSEP